MRSVILACAFSLILLRPSVTWAQEQPPASEQETDGDPGQVGETATESEEAELDQAAAAQPASNRDRMICRRVGDSGHRLSPVRACHTEGEWVELRRQTRETLDHIQNARPQENWKPEADP
jgi:hypothetical protein